MYPEIKQQWLTALRSGEYTQGKEYLKTSTGNYCCLGVLCDLAVKAEVIPEPILPVYSQSWVFGDPEMASEWDDIGLPLAVQAWAGLQQTSPDIHSGTEKEIMPEITRYSVHLSELNDEYGWTFEQIADMIEKYL